MQRIILFITGIFLIGIAPIVITALFQNRSQRPRSKLMGHRISSAASCGVFDPCGSRQMYMQACPLGSLLRRNNDFDNVGNKNNFIYFLTLCNLLIFFLLDNNSDILSGTFIGSSLFQLLAVGGVNQLFYKKREEMDGKGQYLVFCTILLLFLSADYLLTGTRANNMLNRVDGGLLLFVFVLYLFIRIRGGLKIHLPEMSSILYFLCLEIVILPGDYMISQSIPKIGAYFGVSQYLVGLTIVSWCVNFSTILLTKEKNQEMNYLEKIMERIVISITLLLGGIVCIIPLSVSGYMIYDLIIFGIISIALQLVQKIDNRLAASSMATVYIAFIIYVFVR